jgi:hypothetical protein
MLKTVAACTGLVLATLFAGGPALADPDLFSRQAFEGLIDLRAVAADGQPSYLDGGYGRLRYGGEGTGGLKGRLSLADAALVWKPQISWSLGAIVDVEHQDGQQHPFDLVQAYLSFRPTPRGDTRISARAGLYYPPISEEHGGATWAVRDTITPSAINSWVGEEVKVVGGEGRIAHRFGEQEVAATAGLFGYDDTSGTLLTFRGWGLTDIKATAFGEFRMPPLDPYMRAHQAPATQSTAELDGRVGYYGRLDWRPVSPLSLDAFYYDNRGDKTSVQDHQWSWATRFWNFGAVLDLDEHTRILAQGMIGRTLMGYPGPGRAEWIDLGFSSAYLMASHDFGRSGLAGRVEYFATKDRNFHPAVDDPDDDRGEHGWAITAAYRYELTRNARLMLELLHVRSRRPSLDEYGFDPLQDQTLLQSSVRLSF